MISPRANSGRRSSCFIFIIAAIICSILVLILASPVAKLPQLPRVAFGQQKPLATTASSPAQPVTVDSDSKATIDTTHTTRPADAKNLPVPTKAKGRPTKPKETVAASKGKIKGTAEGNMTLSSSQFDPKIMLSAPRRSAAKPNDDGSLALYTVSTYSFDSHKKNKEIRLFDVSSTESTLVTNEEKTSEPNWLEGEILYLREGKNGTTELVVANPAKQMKTYVPGVVPGPISDVKVKNLGRGKVALLCSGKATPEGRLYNPVTAPEKHHTGMLFDSLMVRHWDKVLDENTNALWYGLLTQGEPHLTEDVGRWSLSTLQNALLGTDLESPIEPFPGTDHFDLGPLGIAFVAKDPELDPAYNTRTDFYFLSISDFGKAPRTKPKKVTVKGLEGASTAPSFSPDGKNAVYLSMRENGYEAGKNRVILVQDVTTSKPKATELLKSDEGEGLWDRSPSKAIFSSNNTRLLLMAEEEGKTLLYKMEVEDIATKTTPQRVTTSGHISDITPIGTKQVFISGDSLIDNSVWSIVNPDNSDTLTVISSNSRDGAAFGLSPDQLEEIWFNSGERKVHALVVKPSKNVQEPPIGLKWPLALLIHGGPQGAWGNSWNTRWNPAVFAEAGYYVVMPNPTGSTGYGQDFTDAIKENWGGDPYDDIANCYAHVKEHLSDVVDTNRTVALGASYGGYMMNWIQGQPLAKQINALVCHDGGFSLENMISSDEQYFPIREFGGPFWKNSSGYDKWDPARHTDKWETPMLVIHSDKDYRLPISEGLAAFNVLQGKGIESRFLTFPDENHWVLNEENSLVWHSVVLNWINSFVGLPPYIQEKELFPAHADGARHRKPKVGPERQGGQ